MYSMLRRITQNQARLRFLGRATPVYCRGGLPSRSPFSSLPSVSSSPSPSSPQSLQDPINAHHVVSETEDEPAPNPSPRLFLHGFGRNVTAKQFLSYLNELEGVVDAQYFRRGKGLPLGFVQFDTTERASNALDTLDGCIIPGDWSLRPIQAKFAIPPPPANSSPRSPSRRLLLRGFGPELTTEQFDSYLKSFSGVVHTYCNQGGQARPFSFVLFSTTENASKALEALDGAVIPGDRSSGRMEAVFAEGPRSPQVKKDPPPHSLHDPEDNAEPKASPCLFLHGFGSKVPADELVSFLKTFDGVTNAYLVPRSTGAPIAFVSFRTTKQATHALKLLDWAIIPGDFASHPIRATFATPRSENDQTTRNIVDKPPVCPVPQLFLQRFGSEVTEEHLKSYLKTFEGLVHIRYVSDGTSSPAAYVYFGTTEQAATALKMLNGATVPDALTSQPIHAAFLKPLPPIDPNPWLHVVYAPSEGINKIELHAFFAQFDGFLAVLAHDLGKGFATPTFESIENASIALARLREGDYEKTADTPVVPLQFGYSRFWQPLPLKI